MTKTELEQLVLSQQETINQLTKLLEQSEKRRGITVPPPNWDTFKYAELMKPTCGGYQPFMGSGYEIGNPPNKP